MKTLIATLALSFVFSCSHLLAADLGDATITHAGLVTPDTLAVTIREGEVTLGTLVPYEAEPGDVLDEQNPRHTILRRGGKAIGHVTGSAKSQTRYVRTLDSYQGRRADRELLTDANAWTLQINGKAISIDAAYRKSKVIDVTDAIEGRPEVCFEHTVYLKADAIITAGKLLIESSDPVIASYQSDFSPLSTRSDAIHVSTVGFRPSDPVKLAVLSCWMGDGGAVDYRESVPSGKLPRFVVVDDASGKPIASGNAVLLREPDQPADHRGLQGRPDGTSANYAGTPTFELDFSSLRQTGTYRISVEDIGTSRAFQIADDVYRPIMNMALDGLDAHRWGEDRELVLADGTTMMRPAAVPIRHESFQGVPIYKTAAAYLNANFGDFEPGNQGPWQPADETLNVVGGYMDAGDYDRNHNHWVVGYWLLDLAARTSKTDAKLSSRLIEAALWDINFWAKLQSDDGSVPSAVEYAEHPRSGEPSWLNSLPLYVCAASKESNLHFATSSAKAAAVLGRLGDKDQAARLRSASAKAYQWAASQPPSDNADLDTTADTTLFVCAELWNATNDDAYRNEAIAIIDQRVPEAWSAVSPDGLMGLLTILEMPDAKSNLTARQRERIEGSVKRTLEMNYLDGSTRRSPFKALKNGWVGVSFGNGGWPTVDSMSLLRGWSLFKDPEYHAAAVTGLAYCLGGNPNNLVYMTGVNDRSVRNVLHCDTRVSGRAAPIGIPVYGPGLSTDLGNAWPLNWHLAGEQTIYPTYQQWPTYENVHEFWSWGMEMEYTVHQSHVSVIYLAGMLDLLSP